MGVGVGVSGNNFEAVNESATREKIKGQVLIIIVFLSLGNEKNNLYGKLSQQYDSNIIQI